MVEAITAITETHLDSSSKNQKNPYDWFYNPQYQEGLEKGIETQSKIDQRSQEEAREEIANLYESLGQTPPDQSGSSSI